MGRMFCVIILFTAVSGPAGILLLAACSLPTFQVQTIFGEKKNPQAENNGYDLKPFHSCKNTKIMAKLHLPLRHNYAKAYRAEDSVRVFLLFEVQAALLRGHSEQPSGQAGQKMEQE